MQSRGNINTETLTDRQIVEAILSRDAHITCSYLYVRCYPLFKAYYRKYNYCVESVDCKDFINEFYIYLMTPHAETKTPKLATYSYRCNLMYWLKIVLANYCKAATDKFEKRLKCDSFDEMGDRLITEPISLSIDTLDRDDVEVILCRMSNARYRNIVRFLYIEGFTNEETAQLLGMSMDNFYNKKRLAHEQFVGELRKERLV